MNRLLLALLAAAFAFGSTVNAKEPVSSPYVQQGEPNETDLQSHVHYTNKDGKTVHAPSKSKSGTVPQGATAKCRDGSYSFSQHHRGTCSRHGGVAEWE
jgi:hypothetical protein